MAWHPPGNKPLSEPMMVSFPTRPQWVNNTGQAGKRSWHYQHLTNGQEALRGLLFTGNTGLDKQHNQLSSQWNSLEVCFCHSVGHSAVILTTTLVYQPLKWLSYIYILSTLTHLPLDKMAADLADDICKCIFMNKKKILYFDYYFTEVCS